LTARAATVEGIEAMRVDLAGIVIGRVVEAARHPDSDHLWVTKVDVGDPVLLDVVCGAPMSQRAADTRSRASASPCRTA